jgi:hypothetical protein
METTPMTRMIENHYLLLQEDFLLDELAIVEFAIRGGGHGVELLALDQRRRDIQQALHIRNMEKYADGLQKYEDELEVALNQK